MYLIKAGSPVQRITSDGYPLTDATDGKPETAGTDFILYPEAVLLTPKENGGKWLFNMATNMSWEVDAGHVVSGAARQFFTTGR